MEMFVGVIILCLGRKGNSRRFFRRGDFYRQKLIIFLKQEIVPTDILDGGSVLLLLIFFLLVRFEDF